jgi:hypothetical protein
MQNIIDILNGGGWADWSINKLEIDFETIEITISGGSENIVSIFCKDYIGFSFIGHWDESVIEDIRVETKGNIIDESLCTVKKLYGENPLPGGGVKKIDDSWYQVNIKLIDGNTIKVACKNIEVEGILL